MSHLKTILVRPSRTSRTRIYAHGNDPYSWNKLHLSSVCTTILWQLHKQRLPHSISTCVCNDQALKGVSMLQWSRGDCSLQIQLPTDPVKPTYHQTTEPIFEAETGAHGCIKNEVLKFIVNQRLMERLHRWSDGPAHKIKDTVFLLD